MTNKDLISQYVDTGLGIPEYQYNKLSNQDKKTYLRKMEIAIKYDLNNIRYYYGELPEETQLKAISEGGWWWLNQIKNPTEKVQLEVVKKNGGAIYHIIDKGITPSEEVQLEAVKGYDDAILFIKNPSEKVQLEAVKGYGNAILFIRNPTEKVKALHKELWGN